MISVSILTGIFPPGYFPEAWLSKVWMILWKASSYHQTQEQINQEQEIIELCKKDPRYFAPLYEKYFDQIFVFIHKRTGDEELTADLTSIVFMKCIKNINRFRFQGVPMAAWLYRIAVNEVNQYYRHEKRRERAVSMKSQDIEVLFDEIELGEVQIEPEELVAKMLQLLDPEDLQFIELRFFEGRSFKEIGFYLDMTEVNAKVKTYRILKKLRKRSIEEGLIKGGK